MVGRRQFLIATGSAIGGGIALPAAAWSAWRTDAPRTLLIFDPAFPVACTVAAHGRRSGGLALPLEGDAGAFWYRSILPLLQQDAHGPDHDGVNPEHRHIDIPAPRKGNVAEHRLAITGLTPHAAFFVLSTLATGVGMCASSRCSASDRHLFAWRLEFRSTS